MSGVAPEETETLPERSKATSAKWPVPAAVYVLSQTRLPALVYLATIGWKMPLFPCASARAVTPFGPAAIAEAPASVVLLPIRFA